MHTCTHRRIARVVIHSRCDTHTPRCRSIHGYIHIIGTSDRATRACRHRRQLVHAARAYVCTCYSTNVRRRCMCVVDSINDCQILVCSDSMIMPNQSAYTVQAVVRTAHLALFTCCDDAVLYWLRIRLYFSGCVSCWRWRREGRAQFGYAPVAPASPFLSAQLWQQR
jgi:hypothetical protein